MLLFHGVSESGLKHSKFAGRSLHEMGEIIQGSLAIVHHKSNIKIVNDPSRGQLFSHWRNNNWHIDEDERVYNACRMFELNHKQTTIWLFSKWGHTLRGDKVSMLPHQYPYKSPRKIKVTLYNHQPILVVTICQLWWFASEEKSKCYGYPYWDQAPLNSTNANSTTWDHSKILKFVLLHMGSFSKYL